MAGNVGRPSGLAKTGGRKKGTPNKATQQMREVLAEIGCDPLLELARIAQEPKTPVELRVRIYSDLLPYVYPKRKATDVLRDEKPTINLNILKSSESENDGGPNGGNQHHSES